MRLLTSFCAVAACFLLAAPPMDAQVERVRLSAKVILDSDGRRQASGYEFQDSQIEAVVAFANEILRANGATWRYVLTEIVDLPGVSQWFGPFPGDAYPIWQNLELSAMSDPERYFWRSDAINFYLLDMEDYGGICSFPADHHIILIDSNMLVGLDPDDPACPFGAERVSDLPWFVGETWLHETGHYFNLCHTHSCDFDNMPCDIPPGTDGVDDTLPDHTCWRADEIAQNSFQKPYADLSPDERRQVDASAYNVMSYHGCDILFEKKAILTPGQLARMSMELETRRKNVVYTTCETGTVPGETEADCNKNGILDECDVDCNSNGIPDDCDLAAGTSADCDANGAPDECEISPQGFAFGDPIRLRGGLRPNGILAVDLDGDARSDLVTVDGGENGFTALFSAGGVAFSEPLFHDIGHRSRDATVLDFDGDGDLDIAVIEPGALTRDVSTVSVVSSFGNRTFGEAIRLDVGKVPKSIASADLDADGLPDLAVVCAGSNDLHLLRNGSGGRFEASVIALDGTPSSIAAADLDGDGDQDLVTLKLRTGMVALLFNQGGGVFAAPRDLDPGFVPALARIADLNADGLPDICLADKISLVAWILLNEGTGGFQAPAHRAFSPNSFLSGLKDLLAADLNGDGRTDLLGLASSPSWAHVLLEGPGGGFARGPELSAFLATSFAAGDFSGDGFFDLALAQATTRDLSLYLNLTSPPARKDCDSNGVPDACDIASGAADDRDQDGIPDSCERPVFHRGDPNASGETDISDAVAVFGYLFLGAGAPACLESADANNDGAVDISDGIAVLSFLFTGGNPPAEPGPPAPGVRCGPDPDLPGVAGDLGCAVYGACGA